MPVWLYALVCFLFWLPLLWVSLSWLIFAEYVLRVESFAVFGAIIIAANLAYLIICIYLGGGFD